MPTEPAPTCYYCDRPATHLAGQAVAYKTSAQVERRQLPVCPEHGPRVPNVLFVGVDEDHDLHALLPPGRA